MTSAWFAARTEGALSNRTRALLGLLQLYETAIQELEALGDPAVTGLLRRMQEHRDEVIAALADQDAAA